MRRRDLLFGSSAFGFIASSFLARAAPVQRIGFLSPEPEGATGRIEAVLLQGLHDLGWIEGQNLTVVSRHADATESFVAAAAELAGLDLKVIVAIGPRATQAAKKATGSIPIVFAFTGDPIRLGLVASLARPGGNMTGVVLAEEIVPKLLELARELLPKAKRTAFLYNPTALPERLRTELAKEHEAAAATLGMEHRELPIRHPDEITTVIMDAVFDDIDCLIVENASLFSRHRHLITALAAQQRLPVIYRDRRFVLAGGLASYGESLPDHFRRAAIYVDKLLKGAKPRDLPVEQATRFELVINLRAAKALGLIVPGSLLASADEVIE